MKKATKALSLCLIFVLTLSLCACGGGKLGAAALTNNLDNDSYVTAFEEKFTAGDTPRYVISVDTALPSEEEMKDYGDSAFHIFIADTGEGSITYVISYTSGSADNNPTVINKNVLSGVMNVNRTVTHETQETDGLKRAQEVYSTVIELLKQIEGK